MLNLSFSQKCIYLLFFPLGWMWERIYKLRRFLYEISVLPSELFNVPVISIGNITFGGTGKTPISIFIANYLHSKGKKTMVLTRGYKSEKEDSYAILKHDAPLRYDARVFGDEPVLIAEKLQSGSVVIGKNRTSNFEKAFFEEFPNVVLLDDGHQHLQIRRDLNIVLFDALASLDQYTYPPIGKLREGWTSLIDADVVVLNRVDIVKEEKIKQLETLISKFKKADVPIVKCHYVATNWLLNDHVIPIEELKGAKAVCVAGIANPESFYELVVRAGVDVVAQKFYSDHFHYQREHFIEFLQLAQKLNAKVICTEKDIVKLRPFINDETIYVLQTGISIVEGEKDFYHLIDKTCSLRTKL